MSLLTAVRRYVRGIIFLPYYVTRTYELTNGIASGAASQARQHAAIYADCKASGATLSAGRMHIAGLAVNMDPPRVIETINEVLIRRDYDFAIDCDHYIMIDVGMNVGLASLSHARHAACRHVYGFEPLKPTYDRALGNIALNPTLAAKITPSNFGLSDVDSHVMVKYSTHDIMSASSEATFDSCFGGAVTEEAIEVRSASRALESVFQKHANDSVFLKIDCEGAEFRIIPDLAASGLLARVTVLIVEWHNRDPGELLEILQRLGFSCFLHKINEQWNVGIIKAVRPLGPAVLAQAAPPSPARSS